MLQIAICDDETLLLNEIRQITEDCLSGQKVFQIISAYTDGQTLLYDIQDGCFLILRCRIYQELNWPARSTIFCRTPLWSL